jgi:hypothetical protein
LTITDTPTALIEISDQPEHADTAVVADRDLQRTFRLLLASVWLLDAVLQIQPFMFTPGARGFSGMLHGMAAGNPHAVARTITWNASIVAGHPVLTNTAFAVVQFFIAFGLVWRRTCKAALALSIAWALGVWWFGEGLGGVLRGAATPLGGGPGAVLFYVVLAVVLWPGGESDLPFVAARTVGPRVARAIWASVWSVLAVLSVVGAGRSGPALSRLVTAIAPAQPGWLAHLDRYSAALLLHDGGSLAVTLCVLCLCIGAAVYLPSPWFEVAIVAAVILFGVIWVAVENVGGILGGGATDPNSGLLVILLALVYWPLNADRYRAAAAKSGLNGQVAASCH